MASILRKASRAVTSFVVLPTPVLWLFLFAAVVLIHATLLRLPYFWDEGGYYIPAALDFYHHGWLIPQFTNAHPPLPNVLIGIAWKVFGYHILVTRLLACAVAAGALLAVLRFSQIFLSATAASAVCALTALYSIWYAQSSLAHADLFAALFTLWGLVFSLRPEGRHSTSADHPAWAPLLALAGSFTAAALAKETSILQPVVLAALEAVRWSRSPRGGAARSLYARRVAALSFPLVPLAAWFAYHRAHTGFTFGNPEFLRYNATANLAFPHLASALRYRLIHVFWQRDMWVPLLLAALLIVARANRDRTWRFGLPPSVLHAIALLILANCMAFAVLGGALLTRYLLPVYPLLLLVCVASWRAHTHRWPLLALGTAALFVSSWWLNPPTFFAPEDNLTYRDMVVVHQKAIRFLNAHYPQAAVLTAWPVAADLVRPELGYTDRPMRVTSLEDFSLPQIRKAAAEPQAFDTALVFSTRFVTPSLQTYLDQHPQSHRTREYNGVRDLAPAEIARWLHGDIVWQENLGGEWAAVLRFPRSYEASFRVAELWALRK